METMTVLKIIFTALLCVPVFLLAVWLLGRLIDEGLRKGGRQK